MSDIFQYAILKYVHSQQWDEELNLGILFFFEQEKQLVFAFTDRYKRFKKLYPNFDEKTIQTYLLAFQKEAERLSGNIEEEQLQKVIPKYFITHESAPLQFQLGNKAVRFGSTQLIVQNYQDLYFKDRTQENTDGNPAFQNAINALKKICSDVNTVPKTGVKFDSTWQNNGIRHYVKVVDFNLKNKNSILEKAHIWGSKLNIAVGQLVEGDEVIDLIINGPASQNMQSVFLKAEQIITANKLIRPYQLSDLDNYIRNAVGQKASN